MSKKQSNPPPPKGGKPPAPPRPPNPIIIEGKTRSNIKPYNDSPRPDVVPPPQSSDMIDDSKLCQSQSFIQESIKLMFDAGYLDTDAIDIERSEELKYILKAMYEKYLINNPKREW